MAPRLLCQCGILFPCFLPQTQMLLSPHRVSLVHRLASRIHPEPHTPYANAFMASAGAHLRTRSHTCSTLKPHLLIPDAVVSQQPVGFISMAAICDALPPKVGKKNQQPRWSFYFIIPPPHVC